VIVAILKKIDPSTVVPGKWICKQSVLLDGICDPARKVLRTSGHRVYFEGRDGEAHCLMKSIAYVCDNKAEGDALNQLGWTQVKAINALRAEFKLKVEAAVST
jgi:hypothetical protein